MPAPHRKGRRETLSRRPPVVAADPGLAQQSVTREEKQSAGLSALLALATRTAPPAPHLRRGAASGHALQHFQDESALTAPHDRLIDSRSARWYWPLLAVLTVQAGLSVHLMWANTAFTDEARYLQAGHLEIAHWLHGTQIPGFASNFSGAPVIYPPLGALADSIGGLAAARMLSLILMLAATALLWAVTSRWWGRQAGFFAAALWAVMGPALHLSAFATYDAMALFLLAVATWCAVRAGRHRDAAGWMVLSGTALVLANGTDYATVLYDPVVIALAVLSGFPRPGGIRAFARGGMLLTHGAIIAWVLLAAGGSSYLTGLKATLLSQAAGDSSVTSVLAASRDWIGVTLAAALAGVFLSLADRLKWHARLILLVLAGAALLAPAEQARLHALGSLDKQAAFGAWFAAIAAGYAMTRLMVWVRPRLARHVAVALLSATLLPVAALGWAQSTQMANWPGAANLVAFLRPRVSGSDRILAEASAVPAYYLQGTSWKQWSDTLSITLPSGAVIGTRQSAIPFLDALRAHYFSFVVLSYTGTPGIDRTIANFLRLSKNYVLIKKVPFSGHLAGSYTVWEYKNARKSQAGHA